MNHVIAVRMSTPRLTAFGITGVLHMVLIAGLLLVLQRTETVRVPPALTLKSYVEPEPTVTPAPPPAPVPAAPEVALRAPPILVESNPGRGVITQPLPPTPPPARVDSTPPAPPVAQIVAPRLARALAAPPYPSTSRRLGEAGAVVLGFVVAADGRVVPGSVEVLTGSGYPRLDAAARTLLATLRFVPGTQDGVPVAMRHSYRVVYRLQGAGIL